jgi:hypothetical protein
LRKCDAALETVFRSAGSNGTRRQELVMPNPPSFAYSLCQVEEGWRWSVYDEDGVTVARGSDVCRDRAQAAVQHALRSRALLVESPLHRLPQAARDEIRPIRAAASVTLENVAISWTYQF